VEEGILREHLLLADGSFRTSILFSVLRSDWEKSVQQKLNRL
jgi:RimJ/RimL family protein N-acetyltransferase